MYNITDGLLIIYTVIIPEDTNFDSERPRPKNEISSNIG